MIGKSLALAAAAFLLAGASTMDEIDALVQAGKLEQAFHLAEQRAAAGDHEGEEALGWFYDLGKFVPEDDAKSAAWYRKAAEAGLEHSQWRLGVMLDEGTGVPENPAEAFAWFQKSAAQGYGKGLDGLGVMYQNGRGTTQDFTKALDYFQRAARAHEAHGFFGVATLYLTGQGVKRDFVEAFAWFMIARLNGDRQAEAGVTAAALRMRERDAKRAAIRILAISQEYGLPPPVPPTAEGQR
jgi:TPR repeat protein